MDCNIHNENLNGANPNTSKSPIIIPSKQWTGDLFNVNKVVQGVQLFKELNKIVNQFIGIEARWYRAVPQFRSKDIMLNEYTLSNVEETPYCIKVVLPKGQVPDSKYTYDLMGLEYEIPLEIQIDKVYWDETIGLGTGPQKSDIVYLPISNKIYEVESSFLSRDFMEQQTTWRINLKKYNPKASRRESASLTSLVDQYTVSHNELFGELQINEQEKITNKKQFSPFNNSSKDPFKSLDKSLTVLANTIDIHGIHIAESFYDMDTSEFFDAIEYTNSSDNITPSDDRAISAWFNIKESIQTYDVDTIVEDSSVSGANYKIRIKTGTTRFQIGDTFEISRPGALNFYAKVIDDSFAASGTYNCSIDTQVVSRLNSIKSGWNLLKNYKMSLNDPVCILDGINISTTGLRAQIFASQYIKVEINATNYLFILPEKLENSKWYGININLANTFSQLGVNIWKSNETLNNTGPKLQLVFKDVISITPETILVNKYIINRSNSYMTNIRLFKCNIEETKQADNLLMYFIPDADKALILDNADPIFYGPYISRQR